MVNKEIIIPTVYILGWLYFLVTFEIPTLSCKLSDFLSLSLAQIIGAILFIVPMSIPILFFAVLAFIALLD